MSLTLTLLAFVAAFAAAAALATRMRAGTKWIPHAALAGAAFLLFFELARYDHGYADVLYWIGFIVAPVITIFGGAAWGSRRLYGYPDLGPHPSRAALVAVAVLAGVLVGLEKKHDDIQTTENALKAWVEAGAQGTPPRTRLGFVAPPHPTKGVDENGDGVWGFPVGNDRWRLLVLKDLKWRTAKIAPQHGADP